MGVMESPRAIAAQSQEPVANRRRHVRYPIPARCTFEGVWHPVGDVSVGGFSVMDAESSPRPGTRIEAQLLFPLKDYSIILTAPCIVRYHDMDQQRAGLEFAESDLSTESVIRHLVDAFVANEVVSVGDVMEVSKRFNDAKARNSGGAKKDQRRKTLRERIGDLARYAKGAGFLLLGAALAFYVARNGYSKLFLKVAPSAFIDVYSVAVGALAIGNVVGFTQKDGYAKGETILSIRDKTGALSAVTSPCDCKVLSVGASENSLVREGDILLRLAPNDAKLFIRAKIESATMMKLQPSTTVDIAFRDERRVSYRFEERPLATIETPQAMRDLTGLDIRLETGRDDLTLASVGETARIVFDESPVPFLRRWLLL
jgi:mannuronan synthase